MTNTATTVIGLIPVFLTTGRGSDVMQPMAIRSVGGMAIQLFTTFVAGCLHFLVKEWQLQRVLLPHALVLQTSLSTGE